MCLAIPGQVVEIWESDGVRMAMIDFGSDQKRVCLDFVPDIQVGEYTIVHMGYALQRIDEATALETLAIFREMGDLGIGIADPWGQTGADPAQPVRPIA